MLGCELAVVALCQAAGEDGEEGGDHGDGVDHGEGDGGWCEVLPGDDVGISVSPQWCNCHTRAPSLLLLNTRNIDVTTCHIRSQDHPRCWTIICSIVI